MTRTLGSELASKIIVSALKAVLELKNVARGIKRERKKMIKFCTASTSATAAQLPRSYKTAQDLSNRGLLVFRNILRHRSTPNTLVDVFAVATVSYVLSKLLFERGRMKREEILGGILLVPRPTAEPGLADPQERAEPVCQGQH